MVWWWVNQCPAEGCSKAAWTRAACYVQESEDFLPIMCHSCTNINANYIAAQPLSSRSQKHMVAAQPLVY